MSAWKKFSLLCVLLAWAGLSTGQLMPERLSPQEQFVYYIGEAAKAYDAGEVSDWVAATERLHALRPFNQDFMTHLVQGYARLDRTSDAFNMMLKMQQQGLAEDWSRYPELAQLQDYSLYEHLSNLMTEAGQPFGKAREAARIPSRVSMPEALAYDPDTARMFVGTVRDGSIHVKHQDDVAWKVFADLKSVPDLMAVFGLAIDHKRGHLWVATGMTSQYRHFNSQAFGRTALIKLDLSTGKHLSTHRLVPDGRAHLFGALTVSSEGVVYATDTLMPLVYRLTPEADHPEVFFGSPQLTSLRGLALDEGKQKLYVADYELGVVVLDTSGQQQAWSLSIPETLNLGGIDGLYRAGEYLVAIQNGISPDRVLRLQLDPDGLRVLGVAPVVAALPSFDGPTYGTMHDQTLYFFANSHWQHVASNGRPLRRPLPEVVVLATDIDNPEVQVVGEEILRQLQQQGR